MKSLKKKLLLVSVALVILSLVSVYALQAAPYGQTITAYQGVKILYGGKELSSTSPAYIINNTTYIPLRMLMDNFGDKFVFWDASGYRVIITDKTGSTTSPTNTTNLQAQLKQKDEEIASLRDEISRLREDSANDDEDSNSNADLSDIEDTLNDDFEDAGDTYFDDDGIKLSSVSLSGDEDEIEFTIKLDFGDSNDFDGLSDASNSDIEDFLDDVVAKIEDEIADTDYEDADITGRLSDSDHSSDYVEYEDGDYTYSWDEDSGSGDDISTSDIRSDLVSDCDGGDFFNDSGIATTISVSGSEDDLTYTIKLDFSSADDYDDLSEISESEVSDYLDQVRSTIEDTIDGTNFDGASIIGTLKDNDHSAISVSDDEGDYDFNGW